MPAMDRRNKLPNFRRPYSGGDAAHDSSFRRAICCLRRLRLNARETPYTPEPHADFRHTPAIAHTFSWNKPSCNIPSASNPRNDEVRRLGQLSIPSLDERREIPYATLSLTLGLDRKLYYGAAGREFDYSGSAGAATAHLVTWDLNSGRREDLGEMLLEDGRRVLGTNAADTAADGTIYMFGAIEVRPEAEKPIEAAGKVGSVYYRLALLIYRPVVKP
jgi:hypothetical protein